MHAQKLTHICFPLKINLNGNSENRNGVCVCGGFQLTSAVVEVCLPSPPLSPLFSLPVYTYKGNGLHTPSSQTTEEDQTHLVRRLNIDINLQVLDKSLGGER